MPEVDPIFAAISANDKDKVAQIIAANTAAGHIRNPAGVSALLQALYQNRSEIVAVLRSAAGELDIFEAAALGDAAQIHQLLAADSQRVNGFSSDGFSPLHLACFFGQLEAAQVLVQAGADVNAVSTSRIGVIHSAAASRNAALLKLVLLAGANPNAQQQGGYTALHEAAMHNSVERAEVLLAAGADPNIRSEAGLTAAEMAKNEGGKDVLELLSNRASAANNG